MIRTGEIHLIIAMLVFGGIVAPLATAAEPTPEIATRSVALFTYRGKDPSWRVGASVSGVLVSPKQILASTEALKRRAGRLFEAPEGTLPDRIVAVIRKPDGSAAVVDCTIVPGADDAPFRVLEINVDDRPKLAGLELGPINLGKPKGRDTHAAGVFSPVGLPPKAINADTVPEPYAVSLRLGDTATRLDLRAEATTIRQALPAHMAGAGVWEDDRLVGMLLRRGDGWIVVGSRAFKKMLPNVKPDPITPDPPDPPDPPTPDPPTPEPPKPDPPDPPTPEPPKVRPLTSPELDPAMSRLIKEIGGDLKIDPGFVDYVKQDQADMAMAMLAGGKPDKALELVEDILFLTRGQLAEQLAYRKALALAVKGHAKEAMAEAQKLLTAEDAQVAGRASMLASAMALTEDGQFDGRPISDPAALKAAAAAALGKVHSRYAEQAKVVLGLDPEAPVASSRARTLLYELEPYRHAWPGYFDDLTVPLKKLSGDGG